MAGNVITTCFLAVSLSQWTFLVYGGTLPFRSVIEVENTQATVPEYTTSEIMIGARPHVKNHEGLLSQCRQFSTPKLRDLCRKIAENPVIASLRDHVHGDLKGYRLPSAPIRKSGLSVFNARETDPESRCPDYSKYNDGREKSLSPWEPHPNYDRDRYPQWMPEAKCLCKGCIDMTSGKETQLFQSRVIKVKVRFLRKNTTTSEFTFRQCTDETCFPSDEDIAVGCHCVTPGEYRMTNG